MTRKETAAACRVCGRGLGFKWSLKVMDRHVADYYECEHCGALQVPEPYWLAESYRTEAHPPASNADSGRFRRNFSAYSYLRALQRAGLFPASARILDYGGGYGLLTQMLVDAGYDAWQTDIHVPEAFFAPDRCLSDVEALRPGSFDVVVSLEVFEHLTDPVATAERLVTALRPGGTLVVSTGIYQPGAHGPDWTYLAPDQGQHIFLWTEKALALVAGRLGFRSVGRFPSLEGFLLLFSPFPDDRLRALLARALDVLKDPQHVGAAVAPWDFLHAGLIREGTGALPAGAAAATAPSRPRESWRQWAGWLRHLWTRG